MTRLWQDGRSGIRSLLRRPGTSVVTIVTLALGIGANTAIFSLLNAVLLRPLPVPHPEQLVSLATTIADSPNGDQPLSLPMFQEIGRHHVGLSDVFVWNGGGSITNFEGNGQNIAAALASVSGDYYRAMRIAPLLGRFITPTDVALQSGTSNAVAVISYRAWRSWFVGDPGIIGKTIQIEKRPFTIIGVEPEGFSGLIIDGATDVTVPLFAPNVTGTMDFRGAQLLWLRVYGRLAPGTTIAQARASLYAAWPHIQEATRPPGYEGERRVRFFARRVTLESAAKGVSFLRKRFSFPLQVLLALVGTVLLIACLNLANLSLARAASREHETGVRAALGATVRDLIREPIIESLLLSFAGALLGLALASWMSHALLQLAWTGIVRAPLSTAPDIRVLAFAAAVATTTGLLFALAPVLFAAHTDATEALKQQTRSVRTGSTLLGRTFLIVQIALSLILVTGALLFSRTLATLHTADIGYRRDHLLTLLLFPQPGNRRLNDSAAYYKEMADTLRRLPGVSDVSFSGSAPANELEYFDPVEASESRPPIQAVDDFVGPDFFKVAGMRVLSGREFSWRDVAQDHDIVIVSQSLAEKLFGHQDAVGHTLFLGPLAYRHQVKVVGVVNSASLWRVESRDPMAIFQPITNTFQDGDPMLVIRTTVDPRTLKGTAERAVRSLGRHYSLRTMTLEERLDSFITVQRLTAMLAAFFAGVALLIAAVGLYGLMSFQVSRRTAELGVRVALGAQRQQLLFLVLREALLLAGFGCMLGLAATAAMGRLINSLLFGVSPDDPATLAFALLSLVVIALLAGFIPASRAASLDPMNALRTE